MDICHRGQDRHRRKRWLEEVGLCVALEVHHRRAPEVEPRQVRHFKCGLRRLEAKARFRDITVNRLRRGVFINVPSWSLQKVIRANSRLSSKQNASLH
jgi:hypothetical protein